MINQFRSHSYRLKTTKNQEWNLPTPTSGRRDNVVVTHFFHPNNPAGTSQMNRNQQALNGTSPTQLSGSSPGRH